MKNRDLIVFSNALLLLFAASGFIATGAQAAEKEKVISGSELKADSLVDALDIGERAAPKDEVLTRGMRPLRSSVNRASPDAAGGAAATGRAPLMVTFKTGSADLTAEGMAMLAKVAEALQSDRLAGYSFVVEGHADPRGDQSLNLKLSQGRADSVARHLTAQHGVLADRLKPVGRGSAELYDPVRIDAAENRRVTLVTQRP